MAKLFAQAAAPGETLISSVVADVAAARFEVHPQLTWMCSAHFVQPTLFFVFVLFTIFSLQYDGTETIALARAHTGFTRGQTIRVCEAIV